MEGNSGGGSGSGAAAAGGGGGNDVELMCKTLQVEHKLFYFDLKENPRGRYLKISEKTSATRSTIIVPFSGISWFLDLFNHYVDNSADDQDLFSKELQLDTKAFFLIPPPSLLPLSLITNSVTIHSKFQLINSHFHYCQVFYFDIGENRRGRFLKDRNRISTSSSLRYDATRAFIGTSFTHIPEDPRVLLFPFFWLPLACSFGETHSPKFCIFPS
ncbi:hypothetical protein NC653_000147 [Populus alba x Populus x berolinensis]|uniref:Transcription factor Pur-alpha 1 n=1 Tax=Populus alba x Populus x berolinensis TaxID=444605 RepID=A0AAD6WE13_9ROSI|nr:hypothetical protein NC653_000147 [Populus alba x Populus x berolinensis]